MDAAAKLQALLDALETDGLKIEEGVEALVELLERRLMFAGAVLGASSLREIQARLMTLHEAITPVIEQDDAPTGEVVLDALTFGSAATRELLFKTAEVPQVRRDVASLRAHPRFVARRRVIVQAGDEEGREFWTSDVSSGGLFISHDQPPAAGTQLRLVLTTADGPLELEGVVVRHVAPGAPGGPGCGVKFLALDRVRLTVLESFVERIAEELEPEAGSPTVGDTTRALQEFLGSVEEGAYYEAIGVDDGAPAEEIARRIGTLRDVFRAVSETASERGKAQAEIADRVLTRVGEVLTNRTSRLAHDLKAGRKSHAQLRAEVDDNDLLCEAWRQAFPERFEMAQAKLREALNFADKRKFLDAAKLAEEAAVEDPFDAVLPERSGRWRVLATIVNEMESGTVNLDRIMPLLKSAGISTVSARALWREIFPDKLAQSSAFGRDAVVALEAGKVDAALHAAREALRLDPFNQRVRNVVSACERVTRR